jgi:competence protein ComEC
VATLALTSLIATLMTAPFAAYHFNRLTIYGIAANMLAVPLTGFFIMPFAVLSLIAMPFGLDAWPLNALGTGCNLVLWIAHTVAGWPSAVILLPTMPIAGLILTSFGLIWICLIVGRWRLAGFLPVVMGCLSPLSVHPPAVLAAGDGKLVAVMDAMAEYRFSSGRSGKITGETWLRRNAQAERLPFPKAPAAGSVTMVPGRGSTDSCSADWCLFSTAAGPLGIALTESGIGPACRAGDWVISLEPVGGSCPGDEHRARLLIDFFDLWRHGTHAFSIADYGTVRVERSWDVGDRPWALQRFPKSAPGGASQATPGSPGFRDQRGISTGASDQ